MRWASLARLGLYFEACTFRAMLGTAARPLSSCQNKYFNFRDLYYLSPLLLTDCAFVASILRSKPPQAQIFEVHSNQRPIMPNWTILIP